MNASKRYQIGQVLFALFAKEYALVPFRIAEENVVRTLNGETTTYKAVYGPKNTLVELTAFTEKATVFENLKDAHNALLTQAKATIDKVVADASAKARAWYPTVTAVAAAPQVQSLDFSTMNDPTPSEEQDDGPPVIQFPDGTVGRIKVGGTTT